MKSFLKVHLPYCLKRVEGNKWIVLNRNYQTLCSWDIQKPLELQGIAWELNKFNVDGDIYFLYDDSTDPTGSEVDLDFYLEKLSGLCRLTMCDNSVKLD